MNRLILHNFSIVTLILTLSSTSSLANQCPLGSAQREYVGCVEIGDEALAKSDFEKAIQYFNQACKNSFLQGYGEGCEQAKILKEKNFNISNKKKPTCNYDNPIKTEPECIAQSKLYIELDYITKGLQIFNKMCESESVKSCIFLMRHYKKSNEDKKMIHYAMEACSLGDQAACSFSSTVSQSIVAKESKKQTEVAERAVEEAETERQSQRQAASVERIQNAFANSFKKAKKSQCKTNKNYLGEIVTVCEEDN